MCPSIRVDSHIKYDGDDLLGFFSFDEKKYNEPLSKGRVSVNETFRFVTFKFKMGKRKDVGIKKELIKYYIF